jgi:hypothetical protein
MFPLQSYLLLVYPYTDRNSWWTYRVALIRDGAHGDSIAGICGDAEKKVVVSNELRQSRTII